MANFTDVINLNLVCADPCSIPSISMLKVSVIALGVLLAPGGLPGKVIGGVAGYLVGSKLVDKILK